MGAITDSGWGNSVSVTSDGELSNVNSVELQLGLYLLLGFISSHGEINNIRIKTDNGTVTIINSSSSSPTNAEIFTIIKISANIKYYLAVATSSSDTTATGRIMAVKIR